MENIKNEITLKGDFVFNMFYVSYEFISAVQKCVFRREAWVVDLGWGGLRGLYATHTATSMMIPIVTAKFIVTTITSTITKIANLYIIIISRFDNFITIRI